MKKIGTFPSQRWGQVTVQRTTYDSKTGPTAIVLTSNGSPLCTLSVNMYRPECSHSSADLPADCFYVKNYGGQEEIAAEALASGLFKDRDDLPAASSGFVEAQAWQIVKKGGAA